MLFAIPASGSATSPRTLPPCGSRNAHQRLEKVILIGAARVQRLREPTPAIGEGESAGRSCRPAKAQARPIRSSSSIRPARATGPKAVPLDHFGIIENGFNIGERQGLVPGDRVLVSIPLFWSYGAVNALPATITHGATLVLQGRFEPGGALDLIERHNCTAIYTLPAMTNALLAHPGLPSAAHRRRCGQESPSVRRRTSSRPPQQLGAARSATSMAAPRATVTAASRLTNGRSRSARLARDPRCPACTLRIRDPATGRDCEPGEIGEIEVKGYLTRGYVGDERAVTTPRRSPRTATSAPVISARCSRTAPCVSRGAAPR